MKKETNNIILSCKGGYFTEEMFRADTVNGTLVPMLAPKEDDCMMQSVAYYVFDADKTLAVVGHTARCCLGAQNYILMDKGVHGLDFETRLFTCDTAKKDGVFTVQIQESNDEDLCAELWETVNNTVYVTLKDRFNESIYNASLPRGGINAEAVAKLKAKMSLVRETDFLNINAKDETKQYICLDDLNGDSRMIDCFNPVKTRVYRNDIRVRLSQGSKAFIPYQNGCCNAPCDISAILINDSANKEYFAVLKPEKLLHDWSAEIWLELLVLYRYPMDASAIAKDYPELYREITKEDEYWRKIEPMEEEDEELKSYRLGDIKIQVPCERVKGHWRIKKNPFHFTTKRDCYNPDFGINREYMIIGESNEEYAVSFVNRDGEEYFAIYRLDCKKRLKKNVYACYSFYRFMPLPQILSCKDDDGDLFACIMFWCYNFHLVRDGLSSTLIDYETFEDLYTAKGEGYSF